jgi:hypothetical protein
MLMASEVPPVPPTPQRLTGIIYNRKLSGVGFFGPKGRKNV